MPPTNLPSLPSLPFSVAALLSLAAPLAAATPLPRPALIAAAIRAHGAQATVTTLRAADQWNPLVTEIAAGNADWIALAPKLAPGADAATAISLDLVLAHALTLDAPAVLSVLASSTTAPLSASRVCATPILTLSMTQLAGYQAAAVEALEPVRAPALAAARGACLNALTGAYAANRAAYAAAAPLAGTLPRGHFAKADFRVPPVHPAQGRWRLQGPRLTLRIRIIRQRPR